MVLACTGSLRRAVVAKELVLLAVVVVVSESSLFSLRSYL
jgi:hypothetical protein